MINNTETLILMSKCLSKMGRGDNSIEYIEKALDIISKIKG